jgi:hypothetical protein
MKRFVLCLATLAALAAPASAQSFTTRSYGNGFFQSYTTTGPMGFGAGFAQSFAAAQARRLAMASAARKDYEASPLGHCVTIRTDALFRQKKMPTADQVNAVKAACAQATR